MPNPMVTCTVDECTHNMAGKQCMAAKISIYNDEKKAQSETSRDTLCKSFHQRKTMGDVVGALHNANVAGTATAAFMDGKQITPDVECFVNSCKYWGSANICEASEIKVNGKNASIESDTDCDTFEPK